MEYWAHLGCLWGLFALQAVSLNLLVGEMGLMCLCHAAFVGMGAYSVAILVTKVGLSSIAASLLAPWITVAAALAIGAPLYRLAGDFFAVATFGLALVFYAVVLHWTGLTGGAFGISVPLVPAGIAFAGAPATHLLVPIWVAVALLVVLMRAWRRSPLGRVLNAMREDEDLARSLGKPVTWHRLVAFGVSAGLAGFGGVLYVWIVGLVDPSGFDVMQSVMLVAMVVVGGAGSSAGSVLGAGLVALLPEVLRFVGISGAAASDVRQILFGLGLYLVVAYRPRGLLGRLSIGIEERT